jgi:hypothetical protein
MPKYTDHAKVLIMLKRPVRKPTGTTGRLRLRRSGSLRSLMVSGSRNGGKRTRADLDTRSI